MDNTAVTSTVELPTAPLWAITSYFNPVRYRRRRVNFHIFRRALNVPLVAVELAYADAFELRPGDAEILIQLRGRDVMWQKERLLNLALAAVPRECQKIAWVDCDVLFGRDDWSDQTCRLLDRFPLVQLFREGHYLPQYWQPGERKPGDALFSRPSIACAVTKGQPVYEKAEGTRDHRAGCNQRGFGWGARRKWLESCEFYDACILGSGDAALSLAAYGHLDDASNHLRMNELQRKHYMPWGHSVHAAVAGAVGYVDCDLFHLWHGREEDRRRGTRNAALEPFHFDPFNDIALDSSGCWRWSSDKPAMHRFIEEYFASRKEDG